MGRKLDRNRKYASTYGVAVERFYQDGIYFDAAGDEVVQAPVENRQEPPVGAGLPAGVVQEGAAAANVASSGLPVEPPALVPVPGAEAMRAQLMAMKAAQVKSVFVKAGGPADLTKGHGAVTRMVDWLVAKAATDGAPAA